MSIFNFFASLTDCHPPSPSGSYTFSPPLSTLHPSFTFIHMILGRIARRFLSRLLFPFSSPRYFPPRFNRASSSFTFVRMIPGKLLARDALSISFPSLSLPLDHGFLRFRMQKRLSVKRCVQRMLWIYTVKINPSGYLCGRNEFT